jgi:hypothetical protein
VGGGEIGVVLPNGAMVYTLFGGAGAFETNTIKFAPGTTSGQAVAPGIEVGVGAQFPIWGAPGLSFNTQWLFQQYAAQGLNGGVASPAFNYNFPSNDSKFMIGVSANSNFWSQGINFAFNQRY